MPGELQSSTLPPELQPHENLRLPSVDLQASLERHLRAESESDRTVETSLEAVLAQHASSGPRLGRGSFLLQGG